MENNIGMFGKGRVINGRIVFTEVLNGRGFNHEVTRPEVKPVITRAPSVQHGVSMIKETIEVPSFMNKQARPSRQTGVTGDDSDAGVGAGELLLEGGGKSFSETRGGKTRAGGEKIAEALEDIFNHIGKKIRRSPVIKQVTDYFFGEEE